MDAQNLKQREAIKLMGGQTKASEILGVRQSTVSSWVTGLTKEGVPAQYVPKISELTGIPDYELRPDIWEPPQRTQAPAGRQDKSTMGHFSRHKSIRRNNFATAEDVVAHIRALRDEWDD